MLPKCIVWSEEPTFVQKVRGYLLSTAQVLEVDSAVALEGALRQVGSSVVILDLRLSSVLNFVPVLRELSPKSVLLGFGVARSDPMLQADACGEFFALEVLEVEHGRLRTLVTRAMEHLMVQLENQWLKDEVSKLSNTSPNRSEPGLTPLQLRPFHRTFRHFGNVGALFEGIVEAVASSMMVSRVGIIAHSKEKGVYSFRAGLRCLEESHELEYAESDPFSRWLKVHAHLVYREGLEHIREPSERLLLRQALDASGAEMIIPLHARNHLLGWLFLGQRATGVPFDYSQLEDFLVLAEYIAINLDNALLHEEMSMQKTLLETLLHSMPTGIVAVDQDGAIRWFNNSARGLLNVGTEKVMNRPVEVLGGRMADLLRRSLKGENANEPICWVEPHTQRSMNVQSRSLEQGSSSRGAVVMINDITAQLTLREKQEQVERAAFWTELAASMSHQVRNPLVAIMTFAELLPERYDDPDFRNEFWKLVPQEIDRLNKIIDQIEHFAHPPTLHFKPLDVEKTLQRSLELARSRFEDNSIQVEARFDGNLPPILGDEEAISECFAHLVTNAVEATTGRENASVAIGARFVNGTKNILEFTVRDNGRGIASELREKVYSPFCTTKICGMGLGLPIARRTVMDHSGEIHIDTGDRGTCVSVLLPTPEIKII